MISKLSSIIAAKLCASAVIEKEDEELYSYGLFVMLSRIMFLVLTAVFGIVWHVAVESIVFFILFCLIRSYAGGIHASTELRCTAYTTCALFLCVLGIKFLSQYEIHYLVPALSVLSLICIFSFSPLDSPEKPLNRQEKKHYRYISWLITVLIVALSAVLYLLGFKCASTACIVSLILESILLIAGKIKYSIEHRKSNDTHRDGSDS